MNINGTIFNIEDEDKFFNEFIEFLENKKCEFLGFTNDGENKSKKVIWTKCCKCDKILKIKEVKCGKCVEEDRMSDKKKKRFDDIIDIEETDEEKTKRVQNIFVGMSDKEAKKIVEDLKK
jgi:acetyl-CoA carboxylase beta subunit